MNGEVRVRREPIVFPTYEPAEPDRNPMFLEKRVYQGSSGRVYPLPFTNRIAEHPQPREWDGIILENGLVEVLLLPEIGGRVHAVKDLTNGHDTIYRQSVIKPALVGLAGPWISGGIEFNWPQHHRPSTFMPADAAIEHGEDGSITVWMGEHDPMDRTKGMHGICLHPGRSVVEIKVRLYNRTPYVQTFLWWANMGVRVHEGYKSFFPPDARLVADHAKRAVSAYPLCEGFYYGVDYGERGRTGVPEEEKPASFVPAHCGGQGPLYAANDLSWYANIPVPTSYMCVGTREEFFGGYDFFAEAGLIHIADRHISPGKKQWTWGNHEFGYAWDRNLTDSDGPYIELMAGVFTDNQPDFSYIAPGETKTFSQFLYPYQKIGPARFANADAALSLSESQVGAAATREMEGRLVVETADGQKLERQVSLAPDRPFLASGEGLAAASLYEGGLLVASCRLDSPEGAPLSPATEPPAPEEVASSDELFVIGQHLAQYRHATRSPQAYWQEALRRDQGDSRANTAMGLWRLRRGEFEEAVRHLERAVVRLTSRNPNPASGEAHYHLGLALRFLGRDREAEDAFGKASWNAEWSAPSWHAMAEIASSRGDFPKAAGLLERTLRKDQDSCRAACLRIALLRRMGQEAGAEAVLAVDPLDHWARILQGEKFSGSGQVLIDLVIDHMRAGLDREALELLAQGNPDARDGTAPMLAYYEAALLARLGLPADQAYAKARAACPDWCFPARLEDIAVLEAAPDDDPRAPFFLGCLLYDRRRYSEAVRRWEKAASLDPSSAVAHRCLGIAAFNILHDPERAKACYESAVRARPDDSRLWYERDQLWKRVGASPEARLAELEKRTDLVQERDDLTIEFCALLNAAGRLQEASLILASRRFQPWEGGEGMTLGIFSRTHLSLGRRASEAGDHVEALAHLEQVLHPPHNLGEARHLLANASDLWLALGDAHCSLGNASEASRWWARAADFRGDFQDMAVQAFSELTSCQALALRRLGRCDEADRLLNDLAGYAREQLEAEAKIDYFATSLPTLLLFEDDLKARQDNRARLILAQVEAAQGRGDSARRLLGEVLKADPNHAMAGDLLASLASF